MLVLNVYINLTKYQFLHVHMQNAIHFLQNVFTYIFSTPFVLLHTVCVNEEFIDRVDSADNIANE